jgi:peptidoglycan/LPS O-acetylase OafA/YrhL
LKNLLKIDLNPNRTYGLDILRALAILFVVAGHGVDLMPKARYKYINFFIFDGVNIFFVLSGFLIGGILIKILKENILDSKLIINFWIRRWYRTLPNYFLILIILLLLNYIFNDNFSVYDKKRYFLFAQNLFSEHPHFFPEAWSLSIEEWFYLLIPMMLFTLIKVFKISINNSILFTAVGIIISITLFRYFRYDSLTIDNFSTWDRTLRKQVFTRLDSLMYGVIGAYVFFHFKNFWNKYKIHFLIIGISLFISMKFNLLGFSKFGLYHCVFSFSTTSLATLFLIPYLSCLKTGKGFIYKLITYISLISYSMYLINLTIVQKWILRNIDWTLLENFNGYLFLLLRYSLYWTLTIIISILIYKYFEIPTMNLRDKVKIK